METLVLPLYDAPICNIVTCLTKNRELFALGVFGVLFAEAAILAKREFFFHFFLVALGVMRDTTAHTALEFHQSILDLSHNFSIIKLLQSEKPFHFTGKYNSSQYFRLFFPLHNYSRPRNIVQRYYEIEFCFCNMQELYKNEKLW